MVEGLMSTPFPKGVGNDQQFQPSLYFRRHDRPLSAD